MLYSRRLQSRPWLLRETSGVLENEENSPSHPVPSINSKALQWPQQTGFTADFTLAHVLVFLCRLNTKTSCKAKEFNSNLDSQSHLVSKVFFFFWKKKLQLPGTTDGRDRTASTKHRPPGMAALRDHGLDVSRKWKVGLRSGKEAEGRVTHQHKEMTTDTYNLRPPTGQLATPPQSLQWAALTKI